MGALKHGRRLGDMGGWPATEAALVRLQDELGRAAPAAWTPAAGRPLLGGCYVCFARGTAGPGGAGDPGVAGAAVVRGRGLLGAATAAGPAGAPYRPALLALREGPLLEAAVRPLPLRPEVLLVNATGLDHPRRAGLAIHLGAVLDLPTVGVTDRTLLAQVSQPDQGRGAMAPMTIDGEIVGCVLRTQDRVKPVLVHAGWMTDPRTACQVVLAVTEKVRTPEPLREARRTAKDLRARSS